MKTNMQAIQSLSYDIKKKHPGARRNVLFDDGAMDLVLDFTEAEGRPLRRVTAKQARSVRSKRKLQEDDRNIGDAELDEVLGRAFSAVGEEEEEDLE